MRQHSDYITGLTNDSIVSGYEGNDTSWRLDLEWQENYRITVINGGIVACGTDDTREIITLHRYTLTVSMTL